MALMLLGRAFQTFGPYTLMDLSAKVDFLVKGTSRKMSPVVEDLVRLVYVLTERRSHRYFGANP